MKKLLLLLLATTGWTYPYDDRHATVFAKKFLVNYGFMFPGADDYLFRVALTNYQRQSDLQITGELNDATLLEMKKPRCTDDIMNRKGRWKRFGQYRRANSREGIAKWELGPDNSLHLRWFISRYTNKLTKKQVSDVARTCFASWEKRSKIPSMPSVQLHFEEVGSEAEADINILFAEGQHGDNHPFDGKAENNNILAHTFYPKYSTPRYSGDIHLDDAEDWTVSDDSFYGTKLENVLLHEIGHSLGLTHSFRRDAVMYPVYNHQAVKRMEFDIDDKCALNWIYIGPSNTCLFVWVMSEVLAREISGNDSAFDKYYTGIENNLVDAGNVLDRRTAFKSKLRNTPIPRCIDDNGVFEHIERLLRIRLYLDAKDSELYAKTSCKFLGGMYKVVANMKNVNGVVDSIVFEGEGDGKDSRRIKRRTVISYNFENEELFDEEFYERFFAFYSS